MDRNIDFKKLRKEAEQLAERQEKDISTLSEKETSELIHELNVHQIELKMQNDELLRFQEELEAEKQKYSDLFNHAPIGYLSLDEDHKIIRVNELMAEMLSRPKSDILDRPFTDFIHWDDKDAFYLFMVHFRNEQVNRCSQIRLNTKDDVIYVNIDASRLDKSSHNLAITDVTDLIKAQKKAQESNELKSAFLSNMSHEIRTPLNAILGFSSLLRNKNLSESSQDDYLRNIKQSGERLLRLISDIIDTSKIESNQISIIKENCNLNILIDDVIQQCSLSQRNSKAEIKSIKGLADEESHIITDCHRLTQILINLLTNALKFTKEGAITIAYEQKEDTLQFYVRDTGIGIPADQQENIFKRFSQTDQSGRNVKEGSGLGLSIVKGLLKLMEGEIWVESELGKGSCFYFSIPHNPTDTPTKNIASKTPLNKKFKALQDAVVLVVEDNEVNRFLLEAYLKDHIGKIIEAYNGQEAIELVKSHNDIDVVLMDINMPIMDGYEAVKLIKEYNSDITVIAQTGHAMEAEIQELKKSEFDDYLIKPVDEFKLLEMLKKSIDSN
ncbi:hypothetical protein GCM10027429_16640 [Marivirga atlantica]|jgi:PAS domain S-box-containing protein|uniref:histidine kinase n=1 Tax=Marivirga atlantica TaxID=1548457 RepID=A0A937AM96_9BACT|nr:PAS domain-containing hybrid sensor histidine kinase/response regulator [Marivirga atlantica]MBL0765282.1 response regulator [Marivirga atlantica]